MQYAFKSLYQIRNVTDDALSWIYSAIFCTMCEYEQQCYSFLRVSGTNDAYVTIQLGKEKFQTTVKERSENPDWHEECDL